MRRALILMLGLAMSYNLVAQEAAKQKEVGIVFSNLDQFGLTYKTGTAKSMWRFTTLFISGSNFTDSNDDMENKQTNLGFGLKIGKEFRKELASNLEFRYGADISFAYSKVKSEYDDITVADVDRLNEQSLYKPGANLMLGLNYKLSENFVIGAELLPGFIYTTGSSINKTTISGVENEVKDDVSGFNFDLTNNSVLLSLVYRLK